MDESVDVVLRDSLRNSLRTVDMDILVREIPATVQTLFHRTCKIGNLLGRIVAADEVIDNIGVTDAFFNRLSVAKVIFLTPSVSTGSSSQAASHVRTIKITLPRSPVSFRWRFVISSR